MTTPSNATAAPERPVVHEQFEDARQQMHTAVLGMWTFLATEVLFFGGVLLAYAVYRRLFHADFVFGSHHLKEVLGGTNTAVLLTSSFTVALAVRFNHFHRRRACRVVLALTLLLGLAFLGIKAAEYRIEYVEHLVPAINFHLDPGEAVGVSPAHVQLFLLFYFILTLIHATHMIIGVSLIAWLIFQMRDSHGGRTSRELHSNACEVIALYWHFVDLVWIFLFPILYLVR